MTSLSLPALDGTTAAGWLPTLGLTRLLSARWPDLALSWHPQHGYPILTDGPASADEAAHTARAASLDLVPDGAVLPGVAPGWPPPGARGAALVARDWPGSSWPVWQDALVTPSGLLHPMIHLHAAQTVEGILRKIVTELRRDPRLLTQAITGLGLTERYPGGLWLLRRTVDAVDSGDGTIRSAGSPGRDWLALMGAPWCPVRDPESGSGSPNPRAAGWREQAGHWDDRPALAWSLWADPVQAAHLPHLLGWAGQPQHVAYRRRHDVLHRYDPPMLVPASPPATDADPVGIAEIAARLGVRDQSAQNRRTRGVLPLPRWTVSGRPAWSWPLDIHPWATTTGRLTRQGAAVITYGDIWAKVHTAVNAGGTELGEGIDVDAITRDLIDRYGLVDIDFTEDGEPTIDHDDFWEIVRKHDATQQ